MPPDQHSQHIDQPPQLTYEGRPLAKPDEESSTRASASTSAPC